MLTGWLFRRFLIAAAAVFGQIMADQMKLNLRLSPTPTAAAAAAERMNFIYLSGASKVENDFERFFLGTF